MRELSVYYCPRCGFYAFYCLRKNAICPKCVEDMKLLDMQCQEFMDLDCDKRDALLSGRLVSDHSLVSRLAKPYRENNVRQIVANLVTVIEELDEEIKRLEKENRKEKETVEWMHQMIWDLVRERRSVEKDKNDQISE